MLAGIVALSLVGRVVYVFVGAPVQLAISDALYYHLEGNLLGGGHLFLEPFLATYRHVDIPSAVHPPLFSMILGLASAVGADSVRAHEIVGCLLGAATVAVVGLGARLIIGPRGGLLAAALAAMYPALWVSDGLVVAESAFALTIALVVYASYAFIQAPGTRRAVLVGGAVGLAALTRAEALLLLPLLVLPLALGARPANVARRLRLAAVAGAVALALIAPWAIRNLVTFDEPVLVTDSLDYAVGGANCAAAYRGPHAGLWIPCPWPTPHGDESERGAAYRRDALRYAREHWQDVPLAVAARVGRTWSVFRPVPDRFVGTAEGRPVWGLAAGTIGYYLLLPLALAGVFVVRTRGTRVYPLLVQAILVTVAAAVAWGATRFRTPADVAMVILAAATLDTGIDAFRTRRARGSPRGPMPVEHAAPSPASGE
jgi:4-amino-4-deoxy-L-arabinose transferase-like glycosyltransferase